MHRKILAAATSTVLLMGATAGHASTILTFANGTNTKTAGYLGFSQPDNTLATAKGGDSATITVGSTVYKGFFTLTATGDADAQQLGGGLATESFGDAQNPGAFSFTTTTGKVLFAGTFEDAELILQTGSKGANGSVGVSTLEGKIVSITTNQTGEKLGALLSDGFNLSLANISPAVGVLEITSNTHSLSSFSATATGSFSTAVPEPASWSLMLMGVGGMGAALRRRRKAALA